MVTVRQADFQKRRAEAEFATAEAAVGSADTPEAKQAAEDAKTTAAAKVAELEAQWVAAKAELQQKQDALTAARDAVGAAETARSTAADAARQAARALEPVSVLISRKTQRLYVRQAFEPILESPVTIQDPDHPIGTHVFTAMGQAGDNLRWSVVSLEGAHVHGGTVEARAGAPGRSGRDVEQAQAEPDDGAKAALDRITIPQDVLDRIPGIMPRSSLIITDEGPSSETGKGTDFVVLLSGEPQGGIKFRRRAPAAERAKAAEFGYVRPRERTPYWGSPYPAPFSTW